MNLLLAVTGSISAYKTLDITREWVKAGHSVKVVLTAGALQFVVPQVFKYLGASEVFLPLDDFKYPKEEQDPGSVLHIELGKWADKLILAPLSANSLSRIVSGQAGDLLNSVFLAFDPGKPVLAFPAMNTKMLDHPFVERNLELLDELPNVFVHPSSSGELACGDIGAGKLPTVDTILTATEAVSLKTIDKQAGLKKHILISTGATVSPLDPVRYLTNASSGITGYHLAIESLKRGHKVTVVAGKFATAKLELLTHLPHFQLLRVTTATEMASVLDKYFSYADSYISAAAISDI